RGDGIGFIGLGEISKRNRVQAKRRQAPHWHKRPRNRDPRPRPRLLDRSLSPLNDHLLAGVFRYGGGYFRRSQRGVRLSLLARQRANPPCRRQYVACSFFLFCPDPGPAPLLRPSPPT